MISGLNDTEEKIKETRSMEQMLCSFLEHIERNPTSSIFSHSEMEQLVLQVERYIDTIERIKPAEFELIVQQAGNPLPLVKQLYDVVGKEIKRLRQLSRNMEEFMGARNSYESSERAN